MESRISATELAEHLSDVLNRVSHRGERFLVERNGEPVARLSPVATPRGVTVADFLAQLRTIDWPDEGFADDLKAIQAGQPKAAFPEWPS